MDVDERALHVATEILELVYGPMPIGGLVQIKAKVQKVVIAALTTPAQPAVQPASAEALFSRETEAQLIDAAAAILNDNNGKIGKRKFRADATAVVRRVLNALRTAGNAPAVQGEREAVSRARAFMARDQVSTEAEGDAFAAGWLECEQHRAEDADRRGTGIPFGIIDPDYARAFTIARCLAWAEGYALTLHGSFTRDLDLLAVPWREKASEPEHLVRRVCDAAGLKPHASDPAAKPHGRQCWTLTFAGFGDPRFIDFGVMPRTDAAGNGGEA